MTLAESIAIGAQLANLTFDLLDRLKRANEVAQDARQGRITFDYARTRLAAYQTIRREGPDGAAAIMAAKFRTDEPQTKGKQPMMLKQLQTKAGPNARLELRTGPAPASLTAPATGEVVATITLGDDWGNGTLPDAPATAAGTIGHYRLCGADGTCHAQGAVTAAGGGGDLEVANLTTTAGQPLAGVKFKGANA